MRNLLTLLTLPVLLFACKKDNGGSNTDDVRILKVIDTDLTSGDIATTIFDYNQAGKITKVSVASGGVTTVIANISYTGQDIILTAVIPQTPTTDGKFEVRYTVDAAGKPLKRVVINDFAITDPTQPQKSFERDTVIFEYNGAGLLSKMTGSNFDSTWYNPGVPQIQTSRSASTAIFTQTGNNLAQIVRTAAKTNTAKNGAAPVIVTYYTTDEKYSYEYSKGFVNKTDFSNAVVFSEFNSLSTSDWPMNSLYTHIPDKTTVVTTDKEMPSGNILGTSTWTQQATSVSYNSFGFISTIDLDYGVNGKGKKEIIYNK